MKAVAFLTLILINSFGLIFAQQKGEDFILSSFLSGERLNKSDCIILHRPSAWVRTPEFYKFIKQLLDTGGIVNEDFIDRNALRPGKHKAKKDSVRLSEKEKAWVRYKAYSIQYQVFSGKYLYRFTAPIILRDSVGIFYYEKISAGGRSYCMRIFKNSADEDALIPKATWHPWIKESCQRMFLTGDILLPKRIP